MDKKLLGIIAVSMIAFVAVVGVSAFGFGNGFGFMGSELTDEEKTDMQEQRQAMQTAIETGDYETWKSLMEEEINKMQAQITEENFQQITEQHQKMQECREKMQNAIDSGDETEIETVREECKMNEMKGFGKGFGNKSMGKMQKSSHSCPFADFESDSASE